MTAIMIQQASLMTSPRPGYSAQVHLLSDLGKIQARRSSLPTSETSQPTITCVISQQTKFIKKNKIHFKN